jgi:hypothetical protein
VDDLAGKLVNRVFKRAVRGLGLLLQSRLCVFDLLLGGLVGFGNRAVAFTGPLVQLLLPRLEDPGTSGS